MPIFNIRRTVEYTAGIEAPTAEIALAEVRDWSDSDWNGPDDDEVVCFGVAAAGSRPDFTVDLQGKPHEHDFDDEDTGGCIYCDAKPSPPSGDA